MRKAMPVTRIAQSGAGTAQVVPKRGAVSQRHPQIDLWQIVPGTVLFKTRSPPPFPLRVSATGRTQVSAPSHTGIVPFFLRNWWEGRRCGIRGPLAAHLSTGTWAGRCVMSFPAQVSRIPSFSTSLVGGRVNSETCMI